MSAAIDENDLQLYRESAPLWCAAIKAVRGTFFARPELSTAASIFLKGLRAGASSWSILPSRFLMNAFSTGWRCRTQTDIGSGTQPRRAFGSSAVRPKEMRLQPRPIDSSMDACSRRRYTGTYLANFQSKPI